MEVFLRDIHPQTFFVVENSFNNIVQFRWPLIHHLAKTKQAIVHVFTPPPEAPSNETLLTKHPHVIYHYFPLISTNRSPLPEAKSFYNLCNLMHRVTRDTSPSAVLTFTIKPALYANLYFHYLHHGFSPRIINILPGMTRAIDSSSSGIRKQLLSALLAPLGRADDHIFYNQHDKEVYAPYVPQGIQPIPHIFGSSGVDTTFFNPDLSELKDTPKTYITFVGRLLREKGILDFLNLAKLYPDKQFLVVGSRDTLFPLSPELLEDNPHITYIPHITNREEIRKIYAESACIILPSYAEGCPMAVQEAMAMRTPVLMSDIPGTEILQYEPNALFPPGDMTKIQKAFNRFFSLSPEGKATLGERGRQTLYAHHLTSGDIVSAYMNLLGISLEEPLAKRENRLVAV